MTLKANTGNAKKLSPMTAIAKFSSITNPHSLIITLRKNKVEAQIKQNTKNDKIKPADITNPLIFLFAYNKTRHKRKERQL